MKKNEILRILEEDDLLQNLKGSKDRQRSPVTVYLDEDTTNELDRITDIINKNTEGTISKSLIVENAVNDFVVKFNESESMSRFANGATSIDHLVIIFTSRNDNGLYEQRFHGKTKNGIIIDKRWSAISLGSETIRLINTGIIRFISLYKGMPTQGCEEYAEIDRIELIDANNLAKDDPTENIADIGKYRIYIKGDIKKLPHKIDLGTAVASSLMRGKKTTLRKMFTEKTIDKL